MKRKKSFILAFTLLCVLFVTSCKKDEKAEQLRAGLLIHSEDVTSYHSHTSLSVDEITKNIEMDHDETTGNIRLRQEEGGEVIHLLRVAGQDAVSTDAVNYQAVDKQAITVIRYGEVLKILESERFVSSKENDDLTFEGFDQEIFDNLTRAYSITFRGFVPDEEAKQTNKDLFKLEIKVTPDGSKEYIKRIEAKIQASDGLNKESVTLITDFSDYNEIEPIKEP